MRDDVKSLLNGALIVIYSRLYEITITARYTCINIRVNLIAIKYKIIISFYIKPIMCNYTSSQ